jgi:hypothetical protein
MAKIVVTNRIFPELERRLRALGEVIINDRGAPWSRDELITQLHDADAMLAFMTDAVDAELLSHCPSLKIVAGALKGHDNFDVEACTRAGVWLTVVSDLLTIPTAELAVALTLGLNRNLFAGDDRVRSGHFDGWRAELYGFGLNGAEVGIAGLGRVGLAIAERLAGFGAHLRGFDERSIASAELASRCILQVEWDELIAASDVIILALPLNKHTFHMIDAQSLSRRGAVRAWSMSAVARSWTRRPWRNRSNSAISAAMPPTCSRWRTGRATSGRALFRPACWRCASAPCSRRTSARRSAPTVLRSSKRRPMPSPQSSPDVFRRMRSTVLLPYAVS